MADSFAHLHLHTEYSMLDGAARVDQVVAAAARDGQPAIGITDHGNLYGVLPFYKAAESHGLKPIIGMEGYFVTCSRHDRPKRDENKRFHITMLAETTEGYKNLVRISSDAFIDGYYYKPRLDFDLLERFHDGLIATTGCLGGVVSQHLLQGDERGALEAAGTFQDILGRDNFFVEMMTHNIPDQDRVNPYLLRIAKQIKAPLLATNDSHYTTAADADAHDALLCVQTASLMSDKDRFKLDTHEFYLKSAAQMRDLFSDIPEACDNTLWIAERSDVKLAFGDPVLPNFPLPDGFEDEPAYLRHLVAEGARARWGDPVPAEINKRLAYELEVIIDMGFAAYFLIVWDLIEFARREGIRVGPGRGSAAGCAVSYCLRITDIDPIKYDLIFERFLNPGRREMPDIDMDFDDRYRSRMIRYAAQRYGNDKVAQIITFSTIKARAAVRDASRVLGYPYALGDKIAKAMPPLVMGRDTPLYACFEETPKYEEGFKMASELRTIYDTDPDARRVIDVARGLEGLRRQDGIHAAAVVITRDPLTDYLPIQRKPEPGTPLEEAPVVTQFEMNGVESLGLLKMDFLGLRNLSVIDTALALIEQNTGVQVDIDNPPMEDAATFKLLQEGASIGVFQLESSPMRALMRSLHPTSFDDVSALVALYRPGPMGQNMHTEYADRKNGRKPVEYYHENVADLFEPTYGLMIYQEQLMRLAQQAAGYSLEEADNLRKATGKKKRELIAQHRAKFVDGCVANGYGRDWAEGIFDIVEPFADYSFNKSHSVGYGFVTYQTAYLKANYPTEYMAALLTSVAHNQEKAAVYLNECRSMGIPVLVPSVNRSEVDFSAKDGEIPFGLAGIRNVGDGIAELIVAARQEGGRFDDFHDYVRRVDQGALNKRTVESLIKAGAFDELGHTRRGLSIVFEAVIERENRRRAEAEKGFMSLFGDDDSEAADGFDDRIPIPSDEFDKRVRLAAEKEMLGLYVSDHPMMGAERLIKRVCDTTLAEVKATNQQEQNGGGYDRGPQKAVRVGGVITSINRRFTRSGDQMATFVLEDLETSVPVVVFPRSMAELSQKIVEDQVVCIVAHIDNRDDEAKLKAIDIQPIDLEIDEGPPLRVRTEPRYVDDATVMELRRVLTRYPGDSPVYLELEGPDRTTVLRFGDQFCCEASTQLIEQLRQIPGIVAVA